jgi:shikimate dehydrogenase
MTRPTRLVLLGHPVAHSLSPLFQNAALRAANIPLTYETLDVEPSGLADVLSTLAATGGAGNVTIPHKESVFAVCARVTPIAARAAAVNTFWTEDGALIGHNTDVGGFTQAVQDAFGPPRGWKVVVCGAGGSAAAVLAAVEQWSSCRAVVVARSPARTASLVQRFASIATSASNVIEAVHGADLVVNATPLGLRDEDPLGPVDPAVLARSTRVFDLVYRRGETAWVRAARDRGLAASDGLPMLVEQGALAFEHWFGIAPDRALMHQVVRQ